MFASPTSHFPIPRFAAQMVRNLKSDGSCVFASAPASIVFVRVHSPLHFCRPQQIYFQSFSKRVRNSLIISIFNALLFHDHPHSFAVRPLFSAFWQNAPGGVHPSPSAARRAARKNAQVPYNDGILKQGREPRERSTNRLGKPQPRVRGAISCGSRPCPRAAFQLNFLVCAHQIFAH